jgi:hypothetical protein
MPEKPQPYSQLLNILPDIEPCVLVAGFAAVVTMKSLK